MTMQSTLFPIGWIRLFWLAVVALAGVGAGWLTPRLKKEKIDNIPAAGAPPSGHVAAKPTALELHLKALKAGSPAQQLDAALQMADLGTELELRTLLDQSYAFPRNAAADLAVNVLLRRWLAINATAALAYADLKQHLHWPGLIAAYAVQNPAEAEKYYQTIPEGKSRSEALNGLFEGLIPKHRESAWRLVDQWVNQWDYSSRPMLKKLAALVVQDTLDRLEHLPAECQGTVRQAVAAELMKTDPERAMVWIASQPEKGKLIAEAAAVTFRRDPAKAFAILAGLSDLDRNIVLGNMTSPREWRFGYPGLELPEAGTGQDRTALAAAVMNSPLNEEDRTSLLNHFFWQDPGKGQAFWTQFSGEDQLKKLPDYLYRWSAIDKAAAETWWTGLPPGPVRAAAGKQWQELETTWNQQGQNEAGRLLMAIRSGSGLSGTDSRLAELTPGALSSLVIAVGEPDYGRIDSLMRNVGTFNPEAVAGWFETTPVTDQRLETLANFSARWALDDPASAAAWVNRLPDGKYATTAAFNIARQYQVYDPDGTRRWLGSLNSKPVHEAALKGIQADRDSD